MIQETSDVKAQIDQFFAKYPTKTFDKGEIIVFGNGEVPPVIHLASGSVTQYDVAENGSKLVLNVFKPGAFFPMAHAVNNLPNRYFFEAAEPVQVHLAPADEAVTFLKQSPEVMFDLLQRVYRGTEGLLGKLTRLMSDSAKGVLLYELGIMASRFGEDREDGVFIKTSSSKLAAQTGLARETVSRELQKCAQDRILSVEKGGILLKSRE